MILRPLCYCAGGRRVPTQYRRRCKICDGVRLHAHSWNSSSSPVYCQVGSRRVLIPYRNMCKICDGIRLHAHSWNNSSSPLFRHSSQLVPQPDSRSPFRLSRVSTRQIAEPELSIYCFSSRNELDIDTRKHVTPSAQMTGLRVVFGSHGQGNHPLQGPTGVVPIRRYRPEFPSSERLKIAL